MILSLFVPFAKGRGRMLAMSGWVLIIFLVWQFATPKSFPKPAETWDAFQVLLFEDGLLPNTGISLAIQLHAMLIATITSLVLAYASSAKGIKALVDLLCATRGIAPSALTPFIMMIVTRDGYYIKVSLMVFAIAAFFLTAMVREVAAIPQTSLNYAYTLKFKSWGMVWETVVLGKLHVAYEILTQNFLMGWAMLLTVEALVQGGGGIGRLMYHDQRHSNLPSSLALIIWDAVFGLLCDTILKQGRKLFPYVPKEGGN